MQSGNAKRQDTSLGTRTSRVSEYVTGLQAFPFEISVTTTAGGVTSRGNEVVFEAVGPSGQTVSPFRISEHDAARVQLDVISVSVRFSHVFLAE